MKFSSSSALLVFALGSLAVGCGGEMPPDANAQEPASGATREVTAEAAAACGSTQPGCSFDQGITTCVTTTQQVESRTHAEISGCVAFDGTNFVPGRRTRTFADEVLVTVTTTTLQHGRHGKVFDTSTTTQTEILSSTLISDVCEPI